MLKKKSAKFIYYFFRDLFFATGLCFLFLLIIEDIQPGFVSFWLDFKYFLIFCFLTGVLTLFTSKEKDVIIK